MDSNNWPTVEIPGGLQIDVKQKKDNMKIPQIATC